MVKKITKWYKVTKDKNGELNIVFNHISDGWEKSDYPIAFKKEYINQLSWKNENWSKQFKYMNENNQVVKELNYEEAFDLYFSQKRLWSEALQQRFIFTKFAKPISLEGSHYIKFDTAKVSSYKGELVYDTPRKYCIELNSEEKKYNKFEVESDEDFIDRLRFLHELKMI